MYRFDAQSDEIDDFAYAVPQVCGFAVRDFAVFRDSLWAATELGLSRLVGPSPEGFAWENHLPDLDDPELMRQLTCDEIYAEVLNSPHMYTDEVFDGDFAYEEFWDRLSSLRPGFVSRYLRKLHGQ